MKDHNHIFKQSSHTGATTSYWIKCKTCDESIGDIMRETFAKERAKRGLYQYAPLKRAPLADPKLLRWSA